MSPALISVAAGELRRVARERGLAAGLGAIIRGGVPVPCSATGLTLLPVGVLGEVAAWRLPGATVPADRATVTVLAHALGETEGLTQVRIVARGEQVPSQRTAEPEPDDAVLLLASVRLGLLEHMLEAAVAHLNSRIVDGRPLTTRQMIQAAVADTVTVARTIAHVLDDPELPGGALAEAHERLDEAGWTVTTLFGAGGYLREHPVRCLYVAGLVHDAWHTDDYR
ncbi:hypothetical protein Cme02nite_73110 [Catellatospora methionotrophica]|uniref:Acyl-CoA dehydrogenase/oxidase C-terminal domain-containing protein n=1 Tax=Catellatospora methionotrophica TaxID=121620 RepID=A0A8J3PJM9_9ACTN|nr:hypothetical protein [Catellatospora methionotrophica]GIG18979.1 hypothetical protein Cme02nite_73110 [Catellatospora methionotrophica]